MESKEIILGIIGVGISVYGGRQQDLFAMVGGFLLLFLAIYLVLDKQEEEIRILNAQINTKDELNRLWRRLDGDGKNERKKRK